MDLVSIITPSYNASKFISETINSVLSQTHENWELLIVDDYSSDSSNKIIEKFIKKDNRIKLIKLKENSGPAVARNKAIAEAKGRYVAFLDADDLWYPKKLEKQIDFMSRYNLVFTYSSYDLIDENGNDLGIFKTKERISYNELLRTCNIGCLTAIVDVSCIGKDYMEDVGHEDYTLWLKILKKIGFTYGIKDSLAKYRILKSSISGNKLKSALWQWKIYREVEKLSLMQSVYYFLHYVYFGYFKYRK